MRILHQRSISLFFLGFASGLPLCLVSTTLQAWFSVSGMSFAVVGLLGLIGQPYVFKFLWAPLLDKTLFPKTPRWFFGRRRQWIGIMQGLLVFLLIILSFFNPKQHPFWMSFIALLAAFSSASQDVAIDAYRAEILPIEERGFGTAISVMGYRLALLFSGGLALILAHYLGWAWTYRFMGLCMGIGMLANFWAPQVHQPCSTLATTGFFKAWRTLFSNISYGCIAFILLYKIAEAFTATSSSVMMPLLLQVLHFDLVTVGVVNKVAGTLAAIVGGILAGAVLWRYSLYRTLLILGVGHALTVILFMYFVTLQASVFWLSVCVVSENLVSGMSTTALIAFMMGLCDTKFTATHFAILSAIAAIPRLFAGAISGLLVPYIGWVGLYGSVFIVVCFSLILLCFLRKNHKMSILFA